MKLFWAHHERYPEDIGYYPAQNADHLMEILAEERERTIDYVRENFLYAEVSMLVGHDGKKYKVQLIEQEAE